MGIDCDIDSNMDSEDIKHMEKAMQFETKLTEQEKNIEFQPGQPIDLGEQKNYKTKIV